MIPELKVGISKYIACQVRYLKKKFVDFTIAFDQFY